MSFRSPLSIAVVVNLIALVNPLSAISINLDAVIGAPGDPAVGTVGGQVNQTGNISNGGATTLNQSATVSFNFNSGYPDTQDRATGGAPAAGVFADRKHGGAALVFDKNNNADFRPTDESDQDPSTATYHFGFGMHAEQFITFDLNAIRAANGVPGARFTLAGSTGLSGIHPEEHGEPLTSTAILLDGVLLELFDFVDDATGIASGTATPGPNYYQYDTYALDIPSAGQYLTFVGLSGLDLDIAAAHVGFGDVTLTVIPEPSSLLILAMGSILVGLIRRRH